MKILVLGASGLIGHKLFEKLTDRFGDVHGTLHRDRKEFAGCGLFESNRVIDLFDASKFANVERVLNELEPDVVLNCIGITKRRPEINDALYAIEVNCMLPHRLAKWALGKNRRIIHFSTDCVFDGETGDYTEQSPTTGKDMYGKTKALGEIRYDHSLTIRSSFIGRELDVFSELLEWFIGQRGNTIRGFRQALYSGVSTIFMSKIVGDIIEFHPEINDLHQLAMPEPISKYDLLCLARDAFKMDVEIVPDDDFSIKPTLDGTKLSRKLPIEFPGWPSMMEELAQETMYDYLLRTPGANDS